MTATTSPPADLRYKLSKWDLSELLPEPDEAVISQKIDELWRLVEDFEAQRTRLDDELTAAGLLDILRRYEALLDQVDVLGGYASLWFAQDTLAADALSFRSRMQQLFAQVENRILFFTLWWKGIDDKTAERLLPTAELGLEAEELQDYRYYLEELRLFSPYTLDERSEQLINLKNANGVQAMVTLYSMLTNRLDFHLEIDGEEKALTDGEMRSLFYSPDAAVRKRTFRELFRVYENEAPVLAQIYANRVRDWHTEYVELRGVPSAIALRNLANNVPDSAVETLLDVVHKNAPIFQEYFRLKGGWLGLEKLRRYDVYAPLATSNQDVPYEDAVESVLQTFYGFHEELGRNAERVFAENHIDAEIRKGKKGGAFCATILPRFTPWVLVNYTGRVRDVATLAHELGHAVHSMMAEQHSLLTQHPSLPLAETASVFAEMLMTDRLLASEENPKVRRELLASAVDDVYATVMRQTFFVRFELAAHQAVLENRTADDLSDLYVQNLLEQFGDSVDVAPEFRYEWLSIPHIFTTPFYCYAYSFGQLLVLALYRRYQEEGDAFKPGYLKLLSYGGSAAPADVLSEIGIDIADPAFWQGGFEVVRGMIDELQAVDREVDSAS